MSILTIIGYSIAFFGAFVVSFIILIIIVLIAGSPRDM